MAFFWKKEYWPEIDKLFLEVIEPPFRFNIPLRLLKRRNVVQMFGIRKGHRGKRFKKKTKKEFEENNKFWATPKRKTNK